MARVYERIADDGCKEILQMSMPFDLRTDNPSTNYGIHGLDVYFILLKDNCAVQFLLSFASYLSSVKTSYSGGEIKAFDLGYHSPKPMYEGQPSNECHLLEGGICYYDGSCLNADSFWKKIESKAIGNKGFDMQGEIFKELRAYYDSTFKVAELNGVG